NHPAASDRPCQRPGCPHMIPLRSRADAKYCSEPCARKVQNGRRGTQKASGLSDRTPDLSTPTHDFPQQNQGPRIGPKIWPVNIVGGHRRPNDLTLEAELAATILRCEVGAWSPSACAARSRTRGYSAALYPARVGRPGTPS